MEIVNLSFNQWDTKITIYYDTGFAIATVFYLSSLYILCPEILSRFHRNMHALKIVNKEHIRVYRQKNRL